MQKLNDKQFISYFWSLVDRGRKMIVGIGVELLRHKGTAECSVNINR